MLLMVARLSARLEPVAAAASQVAESLRSRLTPDEVALEFGLKVSGEVNWWFFAKNQAEGTIKVTLNWQSMQRTATAALRTDSHPGRGLGDVAAATAAVFVAGQRAGSAVLVDERRLLTAGHVLRRAETSADAPSAAVEVVFPFAPASEARAAGAGSADGAG